MLWLILVILAVFTLLTVAGPVLEDLMDRVFPPSGHRAGRSRH